MATLWNKRKLAAVSRETPENTKVSQSQNTLDPGLIQEYISQISEEIEGRVTKKLFKQFSRTESRILGASSKLDEFFSEPTNSDLFRSCCGNIQEQRLTKPGTHWGLFSRQSLSRIGVLYLAHKSSKWFKAGRDTSHASIPCSMIFVQKTQRKLNGILLLKNSIKNEKKTKWCSCTVIFSIQVVQNKIDRTYSKWFSQRDP